MTNNENQHQASYHRYKFRQNSNSNPHGLISYLMDVIETSLSTSEEIYFKDCDCVRIVNIPTLGISTINFDITKEEMTSLFNSGYNSAKSFLETWDFNSYINNFRL